MLSKKTKRIKRHHRIRAKVSGTAKVPRLCVFRSNQHIYAQLIDDEKAKTIISVKDNEIKITKQEKEEKKELSAQVLVAFYLGKLIAEKAKEKKITEVIFDRAGFNYHGKVKAIADGARVGGLKF